MCVCMYVCMYMYVCMCVCMYVCTCMYVCMFVCVCMYVCMYADVCCMYVGMYICEQSMHHCGDWVMVNVISCKKGSRVVAT